MLRQIRSAASLPVLTLLVACGGGSSNPGNSPGIDGARPDSATASSEGYAVGLGVAAPVGPGLSMSASDFVSHDSLLTDPFDDWVSRARANYTGTTSDATLSASTAGSFINAWLYRVVPRTNAGTDMTESPAFKRDVDIVAEAAKTLIPYGAYDSDSRNQGLRKHTCASSGSADVDFFSADSDIPDDESADVRNVTVLDAWDCKGEGNSMTGRFAYGYQNNYEINTGALTRNIYAFDRLVLTLGDQRLQVTGVITRDSTCKRNSETRYEFDESNTETTQLLIEEMGTARQLYFDIERRVVMENLEICESNQHAYTEVQGAIYDSLTGGVLVRNVGEINYTDNPQPLSYLYPADRYSSAGTQADPGVVEFVGQGGDIARFHWSTSPWFRNYQTRQLPRAAIALPGDDDRIRLYAFRDVEAGVLADLADTDGDGLPNEWERLYKLDPADPSDAASDLDADGVNALAEFTARSDPTNGEFTAESANPVLGVELVNDFDRTLDRNTLIASVAGTQGDSGGLREIFAYALTVSNGARFDPDKLSDDCVRRSDQTIDCEYRLSDKRDKSFTQKHALIVGGDGSTVQVSAAIRDVDDITSSDSVTAISEKTYHVVPPPVFKFTAFPTADYAVINETKIVVAKVIQREENIDSSLAVDVVGSAGLLLKRVWINSPSTFVFEKPCEPGTPFRCSLDTVKPAHDITIHAQYELQVDSADQSISWGLVGSSGEVADASNTAITAVRPAQSTASLQALINAAQEGDTVTLPAGRYLGGLNLGKRNINLLGAASPQRTILISVSRYSPLINDAGPRTTHGRLTLQTSIAPVLNNSGENVTLENSVIEPVPGVYQEMYRLVYTASPNSYRLKGNHIRNFGTGEGSCSTLLKHADEDSPSLMSVYIEQNVFENNTCGRILEVENSGFSYGAPPDYYVNNNTFVGNPRLFSYTRFDGLGNHHFRNNIVVGAETVFYLDGFYDESETQGRNWLITAKNLVWDSEGKSMLSEKNLQLPGLAVEQADSASNPVFVDELNGDYRLAEASPAIDAGVEPSAYVWTWDDGSSELLAPAVGAFIQSVDGNGDGVKEFDLGALEYVRP